MRSLFETLQSTAGYTELGQETVMSEDHKEVFNMPSEAGLFLELSLDDYSVLGTGVQHEVVWWWWAEAIQPFRRHYF